MFNPVRGGARGGQAEFKWTDVSADKDRENYLGHSINAPTGRWQKNKDVHWYNRDKEMAEEERKEEIRKLKEAEEDAISVALGFKPADRTVKPDPEAGISPNGEDALTSQAAAFTSAQDPKTIHKAEKARLKEEKRQLKQERRERKEARRDGRRRGSPKESRGDMDGRRRDDYARSGHADTRDTGRRRSPVPSRSPSPSRSRSRARSEGSSRSRSASPPRRDRPPPNPSTRQREREPYRRRSRERSPYRGHGRAERSGPGGSRGGPPAERRDRDMHRDGERERDGGHTRRQPPDQRPRGREGSRSRSPR